MLDMILKGADGKSGLITMETLSSDVARILPTFKITVIVALLACVSGYLRLLLVGFHPVLQGILLGLVIGTASGKVLRLGEQCPRTRTLRVGVGLGIAMLFIALHYLSMGWALPNANAGFLFFSWIENDVREIPKWMPSLGIGSMLESTHRAGWLSWIVADALVFVTVMLLAFRQALKRPGNVRKERAWSVYRLVFFVLACYASVLWARSDSIAGNRRLLENWTDEVWSQHYLRRLFLHQDAARAAITDPGRIALETALEKALSMEREFPEGHLLQALNQLAKGNIHYARDELGRSILEAEQMTRRTWLMNGNALPRDLLLAQLYQIRAKISHQRQQLLAAERDLTVAIIVFQEYWPDIPEQLHQGFFPHTTAVLRDTGYSPVLGFAACHYERHRIRLELGDLPQAEQDLKEAKDLGFPLLDPA